MKRIFSRLFSVFEETQVPPSSPRPEITTIQSKPVESISTLKRERIENLCQQLLKRKELITSGKIQFIGLSKIKNRLGSRWQEYSKLVYQAAEVAIQEHLDKGDLFLRCRDDTYMIIFSRPSLEEGQIKAALIAEKIRQKLFALNEDDLKTIEIRQALSQVQADMLFESEPGILLNHMLSHPIHESSVDIEEDSFAQINTIQNDNALACDRRDAEEEEPIIAPEPVEVDPTSIRLSDRKIEPIIPAPGLKCAYMPLWETQSQAITAYLCLGQTDGNLKNLLKEHIALYQARTAHEKKQLDAGILHAALRDLGSVFEAGKKIRMLCPVQYDTLFHFEDYEEYKKLLSRIPPEMKPYLSFLILPNDNFSAKNAFWFATPMKVFCRSVYMLAPLQQKVPFEILRNTGLDGLGVWIDASYPEERIIPYLTAFRTRARAIGIRKSLLLEAPSLSIATSAICSGVDYLGGPVIHENIIRPEGVLPFSYENIISQLL
jgi:hypothetical protein